MFHGAIIIDKHESVTSHDIVQNLRQIFKQKEVGHAGTLDPLATGVLVCLLGDGTKLSQYVMSENKTYEVGVLLGVKTDSGDITGQVIQKSETVKVTQSQVQEIVNKLLGRLELRVPQYSAVKINGKKLYEYAREQQAIEAPIKEMVINKVDLMLVDAPRLRLTMDCAKGTYVRSWVEKLGEELETFATVEFLRRCQSGAFSIEKAITVENLLKLNDEQKKDSLIPLVEVLQNWPQLKVSGHDLVLLKNGQVPKSVYSQMLSLSFRPLTPDIGVRLTSQEGDLVALAMTDPQKGVKLARVFNVC